MELMELQDKIGTDVATKQENGIGVGIKLEISELVQLKTRQIWN
jgi:hypothetical protein